MSSKPLIELVRKARFSFDAATQAWNKEADALEETTYDLANIKKAQVLSQQVAKEIQDRTYGCIASIVTQCLEAVFDEPYKFKLGFVQKRGKTEAVLAFEREGQALDPMAGSGGGVVDVAAFALRLASLTLQGSHTRRLLVLDEPFKFLSMEYRERVRDLLLLLAEKMNLQIVMVTHIRELEVGKVVSLA